MPRPFICTVIGFYMPHIADIAWERYKAGVGIFTMQGFERRNKESKNTLKRFTNKKGNIIVQNLNRLHDIFHYSKSACYEK